MKYLSLLLCILSSLCLSQAHEDVDNSLCLSARRIVKGVCKNDSMDHEEIEQKVEEIYSPEMNALIVGDNETKEAIKNVNHSLAGHKENTELEINTLMIKDDETIAMIEKLNESVAILKEENTKKDQEISELKSTVEKLNSTVQNQAEKLDGFRIVKQTQEFCKVYYGGKCFWYVHQSCTYSQAEAICAKVNGGRPAVVYSAMHYEQLMTYIRSVIDYTHIWVGLKINPSTKEVTIIPEGTPAPFLKWRPAYPNSGSVFTSVTVEISKDPSARSNGMYNYRGPKAIISAVLCEA